MKLISIWDNTPANDNAGSAGRLTVGKASVSLGARGQLEVLVFTCRVAGNDQAHGAQCKKPVAP